jgi:hypothetical protein
MSTGILRWIANNRKPLHRKKHPAIAVTIGLIFGALGVGIYLRSFFDFSVCFAFSFVALILLAYSESPFALIPYTCGSAIYAYHRVKFSNLRLSGAAPAI